MASRRLLKMGLMFFWPVAVVNAGLFLCSPGVEAMERFILEEGRGVYGMLKTAKVRPGETLLDIAREHDLGYNQITAANPGLDPWTVAEGTSVNLPTVIVLPATRLPDGLVVNLAEMRLYYFRHTERGGYCWTSPVGVGREGYFTELGVYTVLSKAKDPVWVVPPSVRDEDPDLPLEVPAGPENPLGKYILRFSRLSYGIHGTNRPWGVGRRVSHGCIRLYPEDMSALFPLVSVGTLIRITYEPVKVGWADGACWLQVFEDYERRMDDPLAEAILGVSACLSNRGRPEVNLGAIKKALREHTGIPVAVAWAGAQ